MCLIWRERRKENWSDLGVFYPGPLKKISPNREKMGEKRWDYHFGKIWPHVLAFFLLACVCVFYPHPPLLFHPLCNLIPLLSLSFWTKLSPRQQSLFFFFFFFFLIFINIYIYIYICFGCFLHPFIFSHLF